MNVRILGAFDESEDVTKMAMLRWDTDTLAWVKFTGNTAEPGANVFVTNFPATQAVSVASLPLPATASTSALQTTGNTTLASLLTELELKANLSETQPISGSVTANPTIYATQLDEASGTVTYVGKAVTGSSSASAVWQVSKITVSGTVTAVTYADGNLNFDNVWDNRASLTYS